MSFCRAQFVFKIVKMVTMKKLQIISALLVREGASLVMGLLLLIVLPVENIILILTIKYKTKPLAQQNAQMVNSFPVDSQTNASTAQLNVLHAKEPHTLVLCLVPAQITITTTPILLSAWRSAQMAITRIPVLDFASFVILDVLFVLVLPFKTVRSVSLILILMIFTLSIISCQLACRSAQAAIMRNKRDILARNVMTLVFCAGLLPSIAKLVKTFQEQFIFTTIMNV